MKLLLLSKDGNARDRIEPDRAAAIGFPTERLEDQASMIKPQ
jgi:hypothetical protein